MLSHSAAIPGPPSSVPTGRLWTVRPCFKQECQAKINGLINQDALKATPDHSG